MKTVLFLFCTALVIVSASCDKHSWKETQVLHEGMHKGHSPEHDAHAGPADHGDKKGH